MTDRIKANIPAWRILWAFLILSIIGGSVLGCGSSAKISDETVVTEKESDLSQPTEESERMTESEFIGDAEGYVNVLEREEYRVDLRIFTDITNDMLQFEIRCENLSEKSITVWIENVLVNDCVPLGDEMLRVESRDKAAALLSDASAIAYRNQEFEIQKLSFSVRGVERDEYEELANDTIEVKVSPEIIYTDSYFPIMGAKASEQILYEDEDICVTLLGLGCEASSEWGSDKNLAGVIQVENKKEQDTYAAVNSVQLNGINFSKSGNRSGLIPAGKTRFLSFDVYHTDLEEKQIQSIFDVKLQILKNREDANSIFDMDGGEWYEVVLSEKGEEVDIDTGGTILIDDERISLTNTKQTTEESLSYVTYIWDFYIENHTGEDVELRWTDITLDGIPMEEASDGYIYVNELIPESGKTHIQESVYYSLDEETVFPTLAFHVRLVSPGRGVIHEYDEIFTVEPEAEIESSE